MRLYSLILITLILLAGCAAPPPQNESLDFHERIETQVNGKLKVSAVVLSPRETEATFQLPLAEENIQPVWLEIENREEKEYILMLLSIDPDYYSASEVAWKFKSYSNDADEESDDTTGKLEALIQKLNNNHIPLLVPAKSTVSGFVYTNLDPGAKAFAVELVGKRDMRSFEYAQLVPGFHADFMQVNFDRLYPEHEITDLDLEGLRDYLESIPCCVFGGDNKTPGDPLNLVIVGQGAHILATLVRRGWDLTETIRSDTTWRTITSSVFGSKYRTSPVSPLYLFGRPQDAALQKARQTVDERNHLRLWLAPVTYKGNKVWVGQISRDIGVKLSAKTIVTHKIDPFVDEARSYITMDIAASQNLSAFGYTKGVGQSSFKEPRYNYTKDPYYTDGLRVVLILSDQRTSLDTINFLKWERTDLKLKIK